jgi:hypothetical protein
MPVRSRGMHPRFSANIAASNPSSLSWGKFNKHRDCFKKNVAMEREMLAEFVPMSQTSRSIFNAHCPKPE